MKTVFVGFGWLFLLGGCLSNNYEVSHAELVRLAQSPPGQRGEHVRVVQQTRQGADDTNADFGGPGPQTLVIVDASTHGGGGRYRREEHEHEHEHHSQAGSDNAGASAVAAGVAAVVVAGGTAVSIAAVEGSRFDGWANVQPNQALLLVRSGERQWLPLSELTERDALLADHAVIPDRGDELDRLARAPLGRQGFAYEFELGSARLNTVSGVRDFGFASRMGLGYFPTQTVGILLGGQLTLGHSRDRTSDGSVFNGRLFGELEYLPIQSDRFHAGLYAELGGALGVQDLAARSASWSGLYAAGGFLAQLDWTTRLAVNLRAGIAALPGYPGSDDWDRSYVPELTLGLSVY